MTKGNKLAIQIFQEHTAACPRWAFSTAVLSSLHCGFSLQELNLETTEQILRAVIS